MYFLFRLQAIAAGAILLIGGLGLGRAEDSRLAFFESRIRPLLAESCYECHASDTKRKGGLLLDSKAGWMIGGDSGPALVPGDPASSLLLRAVSYEEPDLQMPPKKRLAPKQIEDLRRWIGEGAYDPREAPAGVAKKPDSIDIEARKAAHWAWQPVANPALPAIGDAFWPRQSVDHFVLAKLDAAGLSPNEEASPQVLVRRLFFDLIGLPPSGEKVRAFMAAPGEAAYAALVDELLESPHFGERWGQHWLDLVRFAETWGHEQDLPIPEAWRYRDYVIRAFNADVPYDDFLVEHIAGDLVQPARIDPERRTNESIQGTGFWHLGEATHSPVDIREDECTRVSNQIDVFSKAFLGLTVMCARCHDHKFDAISTRDYYALFGYLQSSNYQLADIADPEAQAEAYASLSEIKSDEDAALGKALKRSYFLARADGLIDWTSHLTEESQDYRHPLFPLSVVAAGEKDFAHSQATILKRWLEEENRSHAEAAQQTVLRTERTGELDLMPVEEPYDPSRHVVVDFAAENPGWYVSGYRFGEGPAEPGSLVLGNGPPSYSISGFVLERAAHSDLLSEKLTGILRTKTFEVIGDRLWYRYRGKGRVFLAVDSHRVCQGPLHNARLKMELEGGDAYRWASHDVSKYIGHRIHVEFTPIENFSLSRVQFCRIEPAESFVANRHLKAAVEQPGVGTAVDLNEALNRVLDRAVTAWERGQTTDPDLLALAEWVLLRSGLFDPGDSVRVRRARETFAQARSEAEAGIPQPVRALALLDGSAENEPVHIRGNYRTLSSEPVPRGFLEALAGPEQSPPRDGSGRLQLARQVAGAENPLTSRVFVNRLWHHLFGRGIVETVDNFGATGAEPSHPELLDHLAWRFTSEHAWSIKGLVRDLVLSSTYRMSSRPVPDKIKVDPNNRLLHRMPIRRLTSESLRDHLLSVSGRLDDRVYGESVMVHISDFMRSNRSPSGSGPLDGNGRRSIYIEGRRNHMEPLLVAFDKPTPFTAIGRRNVSSSPAQPLIMLNNAFVHQQAELWAKRLLEDSGKTEEQRLRDAYWTAFSRAPELWEIEVALEFLAEQRNLHSGGDAEFRAWKDLAHTLFNVKEFIFIN